LEGLDHRCHSQRLLDAENGSRLQRLIRFLLSFRRDRLARVPGGA
jgi:hypothetical protein